MTGALLGEDTTSPDECVLPGGGVGVLTKSILPPKGGGDPVGGGATWGPCWARTPAEEAPTAEAPMWNVRSRSASVNPAGETLTRSNAQTLTHSQNYVASNDGVFRWTSSGPGPPP